MEKLFAAVRDRHPGFDVVDFRLLVDQRSEGSESADDLDAQLAAAVASAELKDLSTVCGN